MPSSAALTRSRVRIRRSPSRLPEDSLAFALLESARVTYLVREGRSLTEIFSTRSLPAVARAQVQEIAYGTLRRFGWGDFLLGRLLSAPLKEGEVHQLLMVALYRLETRSDVCHTVVDQAVEAAGSLAAGKFCGLVNGVLRNYLRQREVLLADAERDQVASLWHPQWWIDLLKASWPEQARQVLEAGNRPPPMTLRVNRRKIQRESYMEQLAALGFDAQVVGEDGVRLQSPVVVDKLPGFADGMVSVQDAGAQEAAIFLNVASGQRVLDACAAPGGKTAHLLERYSADVTAVEVDPRRSARIGENLVRLGLTAKVITADVVNTAAWWDGVLFDRILADVPCSGSGVVRRHPDAKWLKRPSDRRALVKVQREMLDALWPLLAPGGMLLYVTCSVFPEENQTQRTSFLLRHPDALTLPLEGQCEIQRFPDESHDGFYFALFQKKA